MAIAKAGLTVTAAVLTLFLCLAFVAHAQSDNLDTEMSAALRNADGADSLSASDFTALSGALADRARESNVSADDIALARIEATLSASAASQVGSRVDIGSNGTFTVPLLAILFVLFVGFVGFLFTKMHHGGALGAGGIGVSGMHKEVKRLPWVT